jgi:hypothetical protein
MESIVSSDFHEIYELLLLLVVAALINSVNDAGFDSRHGEEGEGDQQHLMIV